MARPPRRVDHAEMSRVLVAVLTAVVATFSSAVPLAPASPGAAERARSGRAASRTSCHDPSASTVGGAS